MFHACIFDLDGTLLDTLQDLAAACNHTLSAMGLPQHPVAAYRTMVGNGIPKLVERMLPTANRGDATRTLALEMFGRYYADHMQDLTAPYPGIPDMLRRLAAASIKLGVVSNKQDNLTRQMVGDYFPGIFGAVAGLAEGFPPKPHPASTLGVLHTLNASPTETLYIGDTNVDMNTAKNAGLTSCGVLWGFRDEAELTQAGAVHLAADVEALERLILGTP